MVIELASFKLTEGVHESEFLEAHKTVHEWVKEQKGFVSRKTLCDKEGNWKDLVTWNSLEEAQRVAEEIGNAPGAREWMSKMLPGSISMYHGEIKINF